MTSAGARLLRAVAVFIALAAAIDPAITSTRDIKPDVAVISADQGSNAVLLQRVSRELANTFTIIPAPFAGAAGTVLVGDQLPRSLEGLVSPGFAIVPDHAGPTVALEGVSAPPRAPRDSRVPVSTMVRVSGASGKKLEVTLRMGAVVVDRVTRAIDQGNDHLERVSLTFVPTASGAVPLHVSADIVGGHDSAGADVLVDVREKRWAILFFDPRPSWMSTFVRRALERDPRFAVTSRVITSRNISSDAGQPPTTLDDVAPIALFDALVVGAPEALSDRDVAGLDAFLRRRGGSVVLLFDQRVNGPYQRLTDVAQWSSTTSGVAVSIDPVALEGGSLRATEIAWPAQLPSGAEALAQSVPAVATGRPVPIERRPVVWESAVGSGRLVVSGALDAWRFRDSTTSGFDRFWQTVIAETVNAAPPAVTIRLSKSLIAPGETTEVTTTVRDAALADLTKVESVHAGISASIEFSGEHENIRLWPDDAAIGQFRGWLRAPVRAGSYRLTVDANGVSADAPIIVATSVSRATPDEGQLVDAWANSGGGAVIPASRLGELSGRLGRALQSKPRRVTWHPMRSFWWLLPFSLALGAEWWWRRRRGLA